MNQQLEIIACGLSDAKRISEVAIQSYKDFYLHFWFDDGIWYINRSFRSDVIREEMTNPNAAFFLLIMKKELVGFMKLNVDQSLNAESELRCLELERIYLLKKATGKGLGRKAMEFCIDFAKRKNKQVVWLKSMDTSEAIEFYKRMGFVICGELRLDFELMKPELRGMKILMKRLT
jgi:diamine N-acetyltransferase